MSKLIAIEPFKNGAANIASHCLEKNIKNIYLFPFVFQKFRNKFKNYYFNRCYIYFPDPWPKKKHKKRRLVDYNFLKDLISHCKPNGSVFFASDNVDYFEAVCNYVNLLKNDIKITSKNYKKTSTIITKYHFKALKLKNNVNFLKIDKV